MADTIGSIKKMYKRGVKIKDIALTIGKTQEEITDIIDSIINTPGEPTIPEPENVEQEETQSIFQYE